jgi:hypothetical protein
MATSIYQLIGESPPPELSAEEWRELRGMVVCEINSTLHWAVMPEEVLAVEKVRRLEGLLNRIDLHIESRAA